VIFRHHPDGLIYLGNLELPLEFFVSQEPGYSLPAGAIERSYTQGDRHVLFDRANQWAGEMPWVEGDTYLAKTAQYQAAWDAFVEANQPAPGADIAGLVSEFQFPGNPLYASVVAKVALSGFTTQDHWQNFKLLLNSGGPESAICAGIQHLHQLLEEAGQPLTEAEETEWNALMQKYNLDLACLLNSS
jgi:hypothetical protein